MPNLINSSFFVREITIPNLNDTRVLERLNMYIQKYEPLFLQEALGYYLYKALLSESNGYYSRQFLGNELRNDEQIKVGTTSGLVAFTNSFTFDGTLAKPDYRGYNIVISEINGGQGILTKNVDFSWDYQTGVFQFLQTGNVFQPNQFYNVHFENNPFILSSGSTGLVTDRMVDLIFGKEYIVSGITYNWQGLVHEDMSCIAYFVYYMLMSDMAQQVTTTNVSTVKGENAVNHSQEDKMLTAWNFMAEEVEELYSFLWNNQSTYPEFNIYNLQHGARYFRKNSQFPF